jgi:hypothetical protein
MQLTYGYKITVIMLYGIFETYEWQIIGDMEAERGRGNETAVIEGSTLDMPRFVLSIESGGRSALDGQNSMGQGEG